MTETMTAAAGLRTYRGATIESLLPQIREELGPDAVIVRQREGLIGGVGGFFQKRCVEVDARPGGPSVDVYDEAPEEPQADAVEIEPDEPPPIRNDTATREGLATPAVQELVDQAHPFAEVLRETAADGTKTGPQVTESSRQQPLGPPRAEALRGGLVATGLGADIAQVVVDSVVASAMPFVSAARLRTLVRNELALRIPVAPAAAPGPRTVVVVGPAGAGKSTAIEAIAAAHEAQGTPVARLDAERVRPADQGQGLLLVDTPPLWGGAEGLGEVAAQLDGLAEPEVHLVLRAGTAAAAAAELLEGLEALGPNRLLLAGASETSHLGGVLDVAVRSSVPLGYVAEGPGTIALADPRDLASRVTP